VLPKGPLEETNQCYAIAKIVGIKLCQTYRKQHGCDFISTMLANLYGLGDNFDLNASHVIPALICKADQARLSDDKQVAIRGGGSSRREFLHVDDCADACVHLMKVYSDDMHVNVGSSEDLTILDLTGLIGELVGYDGATFRDLSKPDGTPRKLMRFDKIRGLGWTPAILLRDGLSDTHARFARLSVKPPLRF
jgi:GDP-L-fucose synthase